MKIKAPEDIAKEVVAMFEGLFDRKIERVIVQYGTEQTALKQKKQNLLCFGARVYFDVYRFSKQEEVSPCPVWAMNTFIKEYQTNCIVLGHDEVSQNCMLQQNTLLYL